MSKRRPKFVWALGHHREDGWRSRQTYWGDRCRYPHPMVYFGTRYGRPIKIFMTRDEAFDWLFVKYLRRGYEVTFCKPVRISVKRLLRNGYKWA